MMWVSLLTALPLFDSFNSGLVFLESFLIAFGAGGGLAYIANAGRQNKQNEKINERVLTLEARLKAEEEANQRYLSAMKSNKFKSV